MTDGRGTDGQSGNYMLSLWGAYLSEYNKEIPQSHTADQPMAARKREPQNTNSHNISRQLKQSN